MIYALNSFIKDVALSVQLARISRVYESKVACVPANWDRRNLIKMLHDRMRGAGVQQVRWPAAPMHIYCVGTYYDHEATGFLQSLARFGQLSLYYNMQGEYGLNPPIGVSAYRARESNSRHLVEHIRALNAERRVDCVIGTMTAQQLSVHALQSVRKMGIPVINMAMDDRLPVHWSTQDNVRMGFIGLVEGVDLTLQTTEEYVPRYLSEGCPAIYWPFGSDPELFKPSGDKDLDVVFVGNNYGKRGKLVDAVRAAGIRIECFGNGFQNGHIAGNEVPKLFARAKIVLGTGFVGHSSKIVTLKLRDFDGPMSGSLYLTSYNPDLQKHYEIGKEIAVYKTINECVEKLRYYLANDAERKTIGAAGRARAVREHTWDQRLASAVDLLHF
ncbi:MAG: glycosyltransferase [Gemmatimonadaceae bacterium]|nr:glycosyltransferase [Gemmatimonadaceae bacterium]